MTEPTLDPATDYPLSVHRRDLLFTPQRQIDRGHHDRCVVAGDIQATDLRITPDTLRLQAQISERVGAAAARGRTCGARPR